VFEQVMAEMDAKGEPVLGIYREGSWGIAVDGMGRHFEEGMV